MAGLDSGTTAEPRGTGGGSDEEGRRERLQKVLARAGVDSRRAVEEMILAGRVTVNGQVCTILGTKVDPERDTVAVDGRPIPRRIQNVYLVLNKPAGYITTVRDPENRPTVMDLMPRDSRIYPVGRLDANSEGLLLFTNDGEFANRLAHPRYSFEKEYHVVVPGAVRPGDLEALRQGVMIDGCRTSPARVEVLRSVGGVTWLSITIHEGRNRQVRRMLLALGYRVERLIRVRIGPLRLGSLPRGAFRHLTPREIRELRGE